MGEMTDMDRMKILERVERGEITAAEGMRLLELLGAGAAAQASATIIDPPVPGERSTGPTAAEIDQWKRWWMIPFSAGVVLTALAGMLMGSAIRASGYGFWFFCLWVPFALGVATIALSWASRTARWLHVRVDTGQAEWPRRIAISIPLPLRFTAWLLRVAGPHVPGLRDTALDELILALDETAPAARAPFYVDVAEGQRGERVQVFIG
jgi:hypothetical protein